jgi:Peptidase family M28/PA domain
VPNVSGTWYGLPIPGPATGQVIDFGAGDLPLIPARDVGDAVELSGDALRKYVDEVCAFSYQSRQAGERLWGRQAGGAAADRTTDYVARHFEEAGLSQIRRIEIPFTRRFHPVEWSVRVLANENLGESADIDLRSAVPMDVLGAVDRRGGGAAPAGSDGASPGPSRAHVTGGVVYVDDASAVSVATHDVSGKIAVMVTRPAPASFYDPPREKIQTLLAAGAIGVLAIYDLPGNLEHVGGSCPPGVPGFYLGGRDGAFLLAVIEKAAARGCLDTVRVEASVRFEEPCALTAQGLVGWVHGGDSGEAIIVSAHSDAFFAGANDNATGVAALIGLARHYARRRPARDLCFYLSPGHHHATGGMAALSSVFPRLPAGVTLAVNIEHIAQAGVYRSYVSRHDDGYGRLLADWVPTGWDSPGREITLTHKLPLLVDIIRAAAVEHQYTAATLVSQVLIGEPAQLALQGVIGVQGVETSPWYHTSGDEPSTVSPHGLQRAALFYKDLIDRAARHSRDEFIASEVFGPPSDGVTPR